MTTKPPLVHKRSWTASCIHFFRTSTKLGSGEFGNVCKALWTISGTTKEVAVKTLKPGSSESDRVRFLQEAAIMGQFNHPHVVKLYGVVTVEDPVSYTCLCSMFHVHNYKAY